MRTQYNPNTGESEFILTAEEMKDNDISIRADERNKCMCETKAFIDKHSFEVGMEKGARKFAEWLEKNDYKYGVNSDVYIPDLIAEYEKENKA